MPVTVRPLPDSPAAAPARQRSGLARFFAAFGRLPLGAVAPTTAVPDLRRPPRPDLGPNQLAHCRTKIAAFAPAERAAIEARTGATRLSDLRAAAATLLAAHDGDTNLHPAVEQLRAALAAFDGA